MSESGEIVFVISRKGGDSSTGITNTDSNPIIEESEIIESQYVLSIIWSSGTLGASYYDITTKQLFILTDTIDSYPEFANIRSLLRQMEYKHIITIGNPCDDFVKLIIDFINNKGDESDESDQIRRVPEKLTLLPPMEYSSSACEVKILNLNLPGMGDEKNEIYLHSLIDFNNRLSIHSLGALIKFIEMSWIYLVGDDVPSVKFIHINQISMCNQVYISNNTIQSLKIFQKHSHDAKFKHGSVAGDKEGCSVYNLFAQKCKSNLSVLRLRRLLLSPLKDINELNKRLEFVEFTGKLENHTFIEALQENLKGIQDIERVIRRIEHTRGKSYDWESLYKTVYNTLYIYELCTPYTDKAKIFLDFTSSISKDLYVIENCIRDSLDFSNRGYKYRPILKPGVDEELEKKKMLRHEMGKNIRTAANFTLDQLPDCFDQCTVIYIPEMGHLIAVKKTEFNKNPIQLEHLGFEFIFEVRDLFHYKNAICKELDKHMGQLHNDIIEHEIRIIQRLSGLVLKSIKSIQEPLRILSLIDCLIAMGLVAKENNYVRPILNVENEIEIVEGRHALFEIECNNFVPNDYFSGGNSPKIKIITGPNSCGKSSYLKQNALLMYLAHIGSFLPATSAKICIMNTIHIGGKANESASLPLSALTIDLTQVSQAFNIASTPNSLVIIDEFGRSTSGLDGLALLTSAINYFLKQGDNCPHLLVVTHLQQIRELIEPSSLLSYHTFDFARNDHDIIFLFKLIDGLSGSFTFDIASAAGLDKSVVDRAKEIYQAMMNGTDWAPNNSNLNEYDINYYLNINIPPLDD
ncbi:mutS protein homolog 5-like [Onthophagus taurus]|uniref:mutS protein homolog 5-like n=1 Tax=Onthophagus taurus TaxID=166361 RepID=UPI0039BECB01